MDPRSFIQQGPVAAQSKTEVYPRLPVKIVGSNPTEVFCESVLSGRDLCDELITRPEDYFRLWCVVVCDLENS